MESKARTDLLNNLGMPINALHKMWALAESGHVDSMMVLVVLAAGRPTLGDLLDEFRYGVSGSESLIARQVKCMPGNSWNKLRTSNKNTEKPSSAGLPSLGKRR